MAATQHMAGSPAAACAGLIYFDMNEKRVCVTADDAASMSDDSMDVVVREIVRSTQEIARGNLPLARQFAGSNFRTCLALDPLLEKRKKKVDFGGPLGEDLGSVADQLAQVVAYNAHVDAKRQVIQKLSLLLSRFEYFGRFDQPNASLEPK